VCRVLTNEYKVQIVGHPEMHGFVRLATDKPVTVTRADGAADSIVLLCSRAINYIIAATEEQTQAAHGLTVPCFTPACLTAGELYGVAMQVLQLPSLKELQNATRGAADQGMGVTVTMVPVPTAAPELRLQSCASDTQEFDATLARYEGVRTRRLLHCCGSAHACSCDNVSFTSCNPMPACVHRVILTCLS
jgi:hypothetical protein